MENRALHGINLKDELPFSFSLGDFFTNVAAPETFLLFGRPIAVSPAPLGRPHFNILGGNVGFFSLSPVSIIVRNTECGFTPCTVTYT